ncbi:MAG: phosphoglucosamine mutase [Saprospiraceae bacterium]|nr:phosphoglucosamine mutase [Saprospiraceae bacterium]
MTLIASVSGIRGTIGGTTGNNLTPEAVVRFAAAFASMIKEEGLSTRIVLGRDGRISGPMVQGLVLNTLLAMGLDVIDLGLTTTPTIEMAVPAEKAGGGIILTASHNPKHWNALKLLNSKGEFISADEGNRLLRIADANVIEFAQVDDLGKHYLAGDYIDYHVNAVLNLPYIDVEGIRLKKFHVVVDPVNSSGAIAIPKLLKALGVTFSMINQDVTGIFAHNPEPLPEHLHDLRLAVQDQKADLGIAVDPDVDRLALVAEDGSWFGEEYTLVAAADLVLQQNPGPVVHNLSSSRALKDLAKRYEQTCYASAVGEVHVVQKMKDVNATIGGEGNGGVILPELHYGRDAIAGVAMILSLLAQTNQTLSELKETYPSYAMAKHKVDLPTDEDWLRIMDAVKEEYKLFEINEVDGLKVDLPEGWFHLRKSNTEPIIRIYAEGTDSTRAEHIAQTITNLIQHVVNQ